MSKRKPLVLSAQGYGHGTSVTVRLYLEAFCPVCTGEGTVPSPPPKMNWKAIVAEMLRTVVVPVTVAVATSVLTDRLVTRPGKTGDKNKDEEKK